MINIDELIKNSILNKTKGWELNVYRDIKTRITEFKTAKNAKEYTQEEELKLLNKMRRERLDSMEQYKNAGRSDLAFIESKQIEVLDKLLPTAPTEDDIKEYITTHFPIPSPKKEMGNIIKAVKSEMPLADGKLVSNIVKSFLA